MTDLNIPPSVAALHTECDHSDVQSVEGDASLEAFIAGMFGSRPAWVSALFAVRGVFARMLGLDHTPPEAREVSIDLEPGGLVAFFRSEEYAPGKYWLGTIDDSHLTAWVAVYREALPNEEKSGRSRFHVQTLVRYNNRLGPVYFTLIKPFHVLVVRGMARRGIRAASAR